MVGSVGMEYCVLSGIPQEIYTAANRHQLAIWLYFQACSHVTYQHLHTVVRKLYGVNGYLHITRIEDGNLDRSLAFFSVYLKPKLLLQITTPPRVTAVKRAVFLASVTKCYAEMLCVSELPFKNQTTNHSLWSSF